MLSNKPLIKLLLIVILFDTILLAAFIVWIDATPDVSIVELLVVPVILLLNIILAIVLYLFKKQIIYTAFFINAIISPIIFHFLFQVWFIYLHNRNFDVYNFTKGDNKYEVLLDKRDTSYSISERASSSSVQYKTGKYQMRKDVTVLIDSTKRMLLLNNLLIGYPTATDTIKVKKE